MTMPHIAAGPAVDEQAHGSLRWSGILMLIVLFVAAVFYRIPGVIGGAGEEIGGWFLAIGTLTAYYLGFKALGRSSDPAASRKTYVRFAVAFGLLALLIPPFFSTDVYFYGNVGWQQAHYGMNPYVHAFSETPNWQDDPMFFPVWEGVPCTYGFLFTKLTHAVCWLGKGNRELTALLFKLINAAAFAATGWLVWRGCKSFAPKIREQALYLFLWNPLLLLHFLADGHNDLLMGLCMAGGLLLCLGEAAWLLAIPLLCLGGLVKYGSVFLLPFVLLFLVKRFGARKTAVGLVLGLCLCGAIAAPYLVHDWRHLSLSRIVENASEWRCYTLAAFLFFPYDVASQCSASLAGHKQEVMAAIKIVLWTGFLVFYARLLFVRLRGAYDVAKLLYDSVLVQFVLVCLVSSKFYPWYLGMFLPLAYWLPAGDKLRRVVLAVGCAQVLQFTFLRNANGINTVVLLLAPIAYVLFWPPKEDACREIVASASCRDALIASQ